ncbi:MAG: hypothetical protein ACD_28C00040G0001, partial [uncultured bacterium]
QNPERGTMAAQIVLVENRNDWRPHFPDAIVVQAKEYVSQQEYFKLRDVRVLNFCRNYRYMSIGYYCSLLAEARRHKVIPGVKTITDLSSKSIYGLNFDDLDDRIQKSLQGKADPAGHGSFSLNIFLGMCEDPNFIELSRQLFEMFRCPILRVEFKPQGKWQIASIKPGYIQSVPEVFHPFFIQAFNAYSTKRWAIPRAKSTTMYDLAILQNPTEKMPPSNRKALQKFIAMGKKLGLEVDLIEKKDLSKIAEYDALFIRETTKIDHYTYRFSRRAENEGLVVIDDPDSIVKCTNKIYLAELLAANKIPIPKTKILKKDESNDIKALEMEIPYPVVLKIPDSAFSRGVHKVNSSAELKEMTAKLFAESDIILAQEYCYTEFDWRIGILNRQPLFGCQYFMSRHHWQIVKHDLSGEVSEGDFKTWKIEDIPKEVVDVALKAANLIGNGLYGVDLKMLGNRVVIIEINDNPNLDAGVEDVHLGDDLYRIIMEEFVRRLLQKRGLDKLDKARPLLPEPPMAPLA